MVGVGVIGAARATGAPALKAASMVFVLFRREAVAVAFFLVSLATGRRVVYPALVASGLTVVAATVIAYHRDIDRAIRMRVNRPAA